MVNHRDDGRLLTRRALLKSIGIAGCSLPLLGWPGRNAAGDQSWQPRLGLIRETPAAWFTRLENRVVRCDLCPKNCRIERGNHGECQVRENRAGDLISLVYGNPCAFHLDPIERNPFFHVLPGSSSLAVATAGCNFSCRFCQTWEVSQARPEDAFNFDMPPELVLKRARDMGAASVAYTFVEPVVYFEYMLAIGRLAGRNGLLSLIHSNGYINAEPLQQLLPFIQAANIDLKAIDDSFYRELCGGSVGPVLETMKRLKGAGVHLEITNLVVPTRNDDIDRIRAMCRWIVSELGPEIPLHFWRFYPLYKLRNLPPTPVAVLEQAREAARDEGLQYVYIGNIPGHEGENTFCPGCGGRIIHRIGYMVETVRLKDGRCEFCDRSIPGVWSTGPTS